jgi:ParB/RepB/Spo0J family partition protein
MKVKLKNIRNNPHRDFNLNPLNAEKVNRLKESIEETEFWDNILARKKGDSYELAYGHHRVQALKEIFDEDYLIEIIVRDLNDDDMLKIMINENDNWFGSSANKHEAIAAAKKLHPKYTNKEIAKLLNISPHHLTAFSNVTKAIDNDYIDKNTINIVDNYVNLGKLSASVIKNKIEKNEVEEVYKRARQYSSKSYLKDKVFDNAFKDIQNEKTFLKRDNKIEEKKEEIIHLHQAISKTSQLVFSAKVEVQKIIGFKNLLNSNKDLFRAMRLVSEIKDFIKISQPILKQSTHTENKTIDLESKKFKNILS